MRICKITTIFVSGNDQSQLSSITFSVPTPHPSFSSSKRASHNSYSGEWSNPAPKESLV